ncbi:hypothetical protein ACPEEZ_13895 [Frigoribacterium sp. 2-23]|uniref:hypothetical protein n=1 Tax=Frigoribacterium sp. 2-23 TaxID=3415006 RepID=UPI003C6EDB25
MTGVVAYNRELFIGMGTGTPIKFLELDDTGGGSVPSDMTASVFYVMHDSRKAIVTGTAKPGAAIRGQGVDVVADANGKWSAQVSDLKYGANTVSLASYDPSTGAKIASTEVTVTITGNGMVASVFQVLPESGRAIIGGNAKAGAEVKSGSAHTTASGNGDWTLEVSGLKMGSNKVTLTSHDAKTGTQLSSADVTVDLDVAPLTAAATFGETVTEGATFAGVAQPGATVTITGPEGVRATTVADGSGRYSVRVDGPGKPGQIDFTVTQTFSGQTSAPVSVSLDYGRAVAIEGPADGSDVAGGDLDVHGAGLTGSTVRLLDNGEPVATGTVTNGQYTLTASGLDRAEHVLTVEQTGRGNNVTTATVTVNPGKTGSVEQPLEVTSPRIEDGYVSGEATTFTGKASANSTITVTNKWGTSLGGHVTADADGNWSFTRVMTGTSTYNILFTEVTTSGMSNTVEFFGFAAKPAAVKTFQVTSPRVSDGYVSGEKTTFTGKASAGSTITVTNKWGTSLGGDVKANAKGDWSFTRVMSGTSTYNIVFTEKTITGATNTVDFFGFAAKPATVKTFQVTSPQVSDGYVSGEKTTFTGKASAGSTITITNKWGTSLGRDVKANAKGDWSFTRVMTGTSTYNILFAEKTITGATNTVEFFGFAAKPATMKPFQVTSPQVSDGYVSGKATTFTGKSAPHATISVTNKWGTSLGGDVKADAKGDWSFTRVMTGTSTYNIVFTETHNGTETALEFFGFAPQK